MDFYGEAHFHEVEMLKQLVTQGDVVVDVGANIGVVSVPLAQKVGPQGCVFAIEAQPFLFNVLCGNLALNNLQNVHPLNQAVADAGGKIVVVPDLDYQSEYNYGGVSLSPQSSPGSKQKENTQSIVTTSIDDLNLSNLKLLKVDVEGMELDVLKGATNTIKSTKPFIYIEFIVNQIEILNSLRDFGYVWKLHAPLMFNKNNFDGRSDNIFVNEQGQELVSGDLLCWHPDLGRVDLQSDFFVDVDRVESK